jgi:hypothetical protein
MKQWAHVKHHVVDRQIANFCAGRAEPINTESDSRPIATAMVLGRCCIYLRVLNVGLKTVYEGTGKPVVPCLDATHETIAGNFLLHILGWVHEVDVASISVTEAISGIQPNVKTAPVMLKITGWLFRVRYRCEHKNQ